MYSLKHLSDQPEAGDEEMLLLTPSCDLRREEVWFFLRTAALGPRSVRHMEPVLILSRNRRNERSRKSLDAKTSHVWRSRDESELKARGFVWDYASAL